MLTGLAHSRDDGVMGGYVFRIVVYGGKGPPHLCHPTLLTAPTRADLKFPVTPIKTCDIGKGAKILPEE